MREHSENVQSNALVHFTGHPNKTDSKITFSKKQL